MASYDEKLARVCWEVQARTCKRCLTMFWVDSTILVAGVHTLDIKHCWHVCAGKSQAATTGSGTAPRRKKEKGGSRGVTQWLRQPLIQRELLVLYLALKTAKVRYDFIWPWHIIYKTRQTMETWWVPSCCHIVYCLIWYCLLYFHELFAESV